MPVMRDVKGKSLFPLFMCGMLLVFLFTGKSFAISFGQGLPAPPKGDAAQAARQTVNVNERLQRVTDTLPLAAAKLKTASGGPDKKFEKCIGRSPFEMQIGIGFRFDLSLDLHRSGLYYYRARYYDPTMGRFLQTDPMGYHDSMNLYQAFNQNPLNFLDPLGEASIKCRLNIHIVKGSAKELEDKSKVDAITYGRTLPNKFLQPNFVPKDFLIINSKIVPQRNNQYSLSIGLVICMDIYIRTPKNMAWYLNPLALLTATTYPGISLHELGHVSDIYLGLKEKLNTIEKTTYQSLEDAKKREKNLEQELFTEAQILAGKSIARRDKSAKSWLEGWAFVVTCYSAMQQGETIPSLYIELIRSIEFESVNIIKEDF